VSRIYFPLHTSVELFGDRETPEAITRVKQAAALYDEVIVEDGLLTANISTAGGDSWWQPWDWVDPGLLKATRTPAEPGTPVAVGIQVQPGKGQPAEGPVRWIPQGELLIDYAAEFRTGIIDSLQEFDPDWLSLVSPGMNTTSFPPEVREAIKALDMEVFFDKELMRDRSSFERNWISKSFNHDAVIASSFGATFNLTPLFSPMLERGDLEPDHAGATALELLVPNVGGLEWETILEFREHPGTTEARAQLRAFEEAAASSSTNAQDFRDGVQAEITTAFWQALDDLKPSWVEASAREAAKTAIGLIPFYGPIAAGVASAAEIAAEQADYWNSWHAALLKLRKDGQS
jgi:hypothetical protein